MRGLFITLEGIDGSGKTTQGRLLADRLTGEGRKVLLTREPGGMEEEGALVRNLLLGGEAIWSPFGEALLYSAERSAHLDKKIIPALEGDTLVICDRFSDSSLAYQGYGQGVSPERIARLNALVLGDCVPNLTLVFDLDPERARERLSRRKERSRYEREARGFQERVRAGYLEIAGRSEGRCVIIKSEDREEKTAEEVWRVVSGFLEARQ